MTNGFKIKAKLIFVKPKQKPNKNNSREKKQKLSVVGRICG